MQKKSDFQFAVTGALSAMFNRHRPGQLENIAMFSSRRSGTTLVANVFGDASRIKTIDQPLSSYTAGAAHSAYLPPFAGSYPHNLAEGDRARLRALFEGWHAGSLHFAEPWRIWARDFKFRSDRLFFKFTEAHSIVDEIRSFIPVLSFAFFRHPVPHALSCLRLGWSARGGNFLQQSDLLRRSFDPKQVTYITTRDREGSEFERLLVNWFVENAPLVDYASKRPKELPVFMYENLVTRSTEQLEKLAEHCRVEVDTRMIGQLSRPSRSSRRRDSGSSIADFLQSRDSERIVTVWQGALTTQQRYEAERVFDVLGCRIYSYSSPLPLVESFDHVE